MSVSKRDRFEVFKRDSFTCQYCGAKAPEVILHADHVKPVAAGGTDDILNLVTACQPCNSGKSDRPLSDNSVIEKQRRQLEDLQERREQLDMMFEWQLGLAGLQDQTVQRLADYWCSLVGWEGLNEHGVAALKKLLKKFSLAEIMPAMRTAVDQYVGPEGVTSENTNHAFNKIGGICRVSGLSDDERELYYIRGIIRKRCDYFNPWQATNILRNAVDAGVAVTELHAMACRARNWSSWRREILEAVEAVNA
jgi:hypothetical protein